jgi:Zn-dependent peptidase ImmA (M78 family)
MYIDPDIYRPIATKLHQKLKPTVPVDIVALIRSFSDIIAVTVDMLPDKPLVTYDNGVYTFTVIDNPTPKERFQITVELAHILLGHVTNTYNLYRKNANELMFEANTLGAAILCPENDFREAILDYTDKDDYADMEQVAKHFNIPLSVAKTFGHQLNLIQP